MKRVYGPYVGRIDYQYSCGRNWETQHYEPIKWRQFVARLTWKFFKKQWPQSTHVLVGGE